MLTFSSHEEILGLGVPWVCQAERDVGGTQGCLDQVFFNCSSLVTVPTVAATSLPFLCPSNMVDEMASSVKQPRAQPFSMRRLRRERRGRIHSHSATMVSRDTSVPGKLLKAFGAHQLLLLCVCVHACVHACVTACVCVCI